MAIVAEVVKRTTGYWNMHLQMVSLSSEWKSWTCQRKEGRGIGVFWTMVAMIVAVMATMKFCWYAVGVFLDQI